MTNTLLENEAKPCPDCGDPDEYYPLAYQILGKIIFCGDDIGQCLKCGYDNEGKQ